MKFTPIIDDDTQNNISKIRKNPLGAKKVIAKIENEKNLNISFFSNKNKNLVGHEIRGFKGR